MTRGLVRWWVIVAGAMIPGVLGSVASLMARWLVFLNSGAWDPPIGEICAFIGSVIGCGIAVVIVFSELVDR